MNRSFDIRRVLMISPHFPPDATAAAHRVRLLAPHLPAFGWKPTVLTVDERDYEGGLDRELHSLVPPDLEVIRCRAVAAKWTRLVRIGDGVAVQVLPDGEVVGAGVHALPRDADIAAAVGALRQSGRCRA